MTVIVKYFVFAAILAARALAATTYHVDCSLSSLGKGTLSSPWTSLSQVNDVTFQPGDVISFKTGTTCIGTLSPKGSGTASSAIHITKYGDDTLDKPIINGNGATAALTLTNQDYWYISNLAITNPADSLVRRQGIHVAATDGETHTGITIDSNTVYKVAGQTSKASHSDDFVASAGILVQIDGDGSRWDDVLVINNHVSDCGGGGIKVRVGAMDNHGQNTHVTQNTIDACGGDGIIISYSELPLMDYNVASNLGKGAYPWTGGNFAGMWVLGNHNPTISHNVVYGSIMSSYDSEAFDCDWGNTGNCTIEYNYSHDNAGGAFLNCDGCGTSGGADQIVRYNIFQNDCRMISSGNAPTLYFYQNVMYCPDKAFEIEVPKNTHFINNIFVGNSHSSLPTGSGIHWRWNVFQNVMRPTQNGIEDDPGFVDPGSGGNDMASVGGYRLKVTSPALTNGEVIPDNGGVDFYGNSVSATKKPNRGAYNGPGVAT